MPYYKAVHYSIWCDFCQEFEDYIPFKNLKEATHLWREIGWRKDGQCWKCPTCVEREKNGVNLLLMATA